MNIPHYYEMMVPTIKVIDALGGSGTIQEIAEGVVQFLDLPEEVTSHLHNPEKSSQTEVEYRLAWASSEDSLSICNTTVDPNRSDEKISRKKVNHLSRSYASL